MDVTEIYYIKSNSIYSLPEASYRRFIVIPVLLAIGQGTKAYARQVVKINNIEVVRVEAQLGSVNCIGWTGVIEPNQSASIAVEEKNIPRWKYNGWYHRFNRESITALKRTVRTIMKIKTVLLSLFFLAVCTGTAAAGTLFTTLGYAFTHERHVQSADGFTVKYGYREDGSSVGFMTSLSYLYSDSNPKGDGIRGDTLKIIKNSDIKYFGVGPYWHVTPVLSLYATAGVGRVAIQYRNRKDDVVTNTSYRRTGFGYGTGVIINLTENILFSIGTQSVKYEDKEVRGKFLNMYDVSLGYQW